ncbi:MAG: tRNA uridine-5-carboxymethylaminomethyl(34) synthesis GTPase MnmE [Bacteroidia bacterium]
MHTWQDTIVALATPLAPSALGVIRVSGPDAHKLFGQIWKGKPFPASPKPQIQLGKVFTPQGELLDHVLATVFTAPRSYTGENVVEISAHGSPYILRRIVESFIFLGARLAQPGEFTLRAYLNGKINLLQAEALADLIQARSQKAHQLALSQLEGPFAQKLKNLRQKLVDFTALMELELDFSEEDVEFVPADRLDTLLAEIQKEVTQLLQTFTQGKSLREGIPIALIGPPNAGKSTLLNALLQQNRAIVSDIPGTTRDVIEEKIYLGGYEVRLIDTAGIHSSPQDPIEAEGIQRTFHKLQEAHIVLYLFDCTQTPEMEALDQLSRLPLPPNAQLFLLANKIDLLPTVPPFEKALPLSARSGIGLQLLWQKITTYLDENYSSEVFITHERHYQALQKTQTSLETALMHLRSGWSKDLIAQDLRYALYALGEITGEVAPDEILGNIFSRFCIGK